MLAQSLIARRDGRRWPWALVVALWVAGTGCGFSQAALPGTQPLTLSGDLSAQMVAGIDQYLTRETEASVEERQRHWRRDFSSKIAYEKSVEPNRERLRRMIGAVDARLPATGFESVVDARSPACIAQTGAISVYAVRWPVLEGVFGEGLWLRPAGAALGRVIALPDADQTPEMLAGLAPGLPPERQFARRLAENGCEVLVPVVVDRQDTWSGSEFVGRFTNQPHREWLYRPAFELGRHIIGYEVQTVLAAIDCLEVEIPTPESQAPKVGVAGYGEGGLLALYAAALDPRIEAALVSGYFGAREQLWEEPIYRNLFGVLREFGDAEIATLVAPRGLVIEHSPAPAVAGPPNPRPGRSGAAPGRLTTPEYDLVEAEVERARALLAPSEEFAAFKFITGTEGMTTGPGSERALAAFLEKMGLKIEVLKPAGPAPVDARDAFDPAHRMRRQVTALEAHTQKILRHCERARREFFWAKLNLQSPDEWRAASAPFRDAFWDGNLGRLPATALPVNAKTRKLADRPRWTGYEVVLDVLPDVFAWGYLLVPRDVGAAERRPVVVCQHGLEGVPADVINEDTNSAAFKSYKAFAARLAERGFVVFAPHNPYRGGDQFRRLQRKANPLGKSLFSFITAQHSQVLRWLGELPFVDPKRIGFYGLSYGGKTAMRVPALLEGYALSICSGDFNEWVRKNASTELPESYVFTREYEMPEWNLGHTFNYAEMAGLIAPRPFVVERGHQDGVGSDEWVAYEYAKVRRLYDQLGIPDRTAIELFNGPHTINGRGTFDFLERQLNWPVK